ncbi:MAG: SOS response-associated peptidase [Planctomycetaceae bacterium]|nr:SOS response-associated peptidase [Planctomycetaceae bacterium]
MCGRFTLRTAPREVAELFAIDELPLFAPRYNIAPSQQVLAVGLRDDGRREFRQFAWGFIPSWSKDPQSGHRPINIRSETVLEKPMFRSAFRKRRCLIPADGFFEWQAVGRAKQPYYFQRPDGGPFAFAGVWETWRGGAEPLESCALFTTSANATVAPLHDRMPVILAPADFASWLDPTNEDPASLVPLLRPLPPDQLVARPVSTTVNSPRHDSPECIIPLESPGKLFD